MGMNRSDLRAEALERDGGCVWPQCTGTEPLEMAHIRGIGMGGRPSADTLDNVAILCRFHHALLDGRSHFRLRVELSNLLSAYLSDSENQR